MAVFSRNDSAPDASSAAMEQHAEDTTLWIVAFLVVAALMIAAGVGWLLFGPPIS
jgi:hypothetical protein